MNDGISTTKISDLPDSNSGKLPQYTLPSAPASSGSSQPVFNQTYVPLDIHPNPYGNMPPHETMLPRPVETKNQEQGNNLGYLMGGGMMPNGAPMYQLPSRDIPRDTLPLVQDEGVRANYIPPATRSNLGIIEEDEWAPRPKDKKKKVHFEEDVLLQWQRPILIGLIFLLFQMPMITVLMLKYLTFLKLSDDAGNLNYTGFIIKSIFFGLSVYGIEILLENSKQ